MSTSLLAQDTDSKFYYVVIGGFESEENASRFTATASDIFAQANYTFNTDRGIFYVYTFKTKKKSEAYAMGAETRGKPGFQDAWVYFGSLEPLVEETPPPVVVEPEQEPVVASVEEEIVEETIEEVPAEEPVAEVEKEIIKPNQRPFRFTLVNINTGKEVMGKVYVGETRESNTFETYNGNERVVVTQPANQDQIYSVVVNAPGFLPVETTLDYATYANVSNDREALSTVTIPLKQVRKGKYVEFNNVNFLINSALLAPQAETELEAFAQLLQENPNYKIRVHGHCNGKFDRNALIKAEGSEFFGKSDGNEELSLSPKKLTKYRAEIVKDYLVEQGISSKRIKTASIGAQAMLFPSNGPLSKLNDRVEIEIIRGK